MLPGVSWIGAAQCCICESAGRAETALIFLSNLLNADLCFGVLSVSWMGLHLNNIEMVLQSSRPAFNPSGVMTWDFSEQGNSVFMPRVIDAKMAVA
jgi:hypothetical protein